MITFLAVLFMTVVVVVGCGVLIAALDEWIKQRRINKRRWRP